jgi:hypothetical protein
MWRHRWFVLLPDAVDGRVELLADLVCDGEADAGRLIADLGPQTMNHWCDQLCPNSSLILRTRRHDVGQAVAQNALGQ